MGFDSTAELLFAISADSRDAENNVKRFRAILAKDLGQIKTEFKGWADDVFGNLKTVEGRMNAGMAAGLAAATVAAAGAVLLGKELVGAAKAAAQYAGEIDDAGDKTGLSAENLSRLRYAAKQVGVDFGQLSGGLTKFALAIAEAQDPTSATAQMFHRLGVTQAEIKAGAENMMPLLDKVSDAFSQQSSAVEQTAAARALLSKTGPELVEFLSLGSRGMRQFSEEAERLGLVLGEKDLKAAQEFKWGVLQVQEALEGFKISIGRDVLPALNEFFLYLEAWSRTAPQTLKIWKEEPWWKALIPGGREIAATREGLGIFEKELASARERLQQRLAALFEKKGNTRLAPGDEDKAGWRDITHLLDSVREKASGVASEDAQISAQTAHLTKQTKELGEELAKAWSQKKISPATYQREARALAALPTAIEELANAERRKLQQKHNASVLSAETELRGRLAGLQQQTLDSQLNAWDLEMEQLAQKLGEQGTWNANTADLLMRIWRTGGEKIGREYNEAILAAQRQLQMELLGMEKQTWDRQHEAVDRQVDDQIAAAKKANQADLIPLLEEKRRLGHANIRQQQTEAFQAELVDLQQHLAQMVQRRMTASEQLKFTYDQELQRYSEAREQEALEDAQTEGEKAAIEQQYALNRQALLDEYGFALNRLHNSQGWRGVFGEVFGQSIRENEKLLREWSETANQSHMMVRVSLAALGDLLRRTFQQWTNAMGQNITQAFIYKKSIGEAMREATASTLASLSAEALVYAIYATGLGFLRLAQHDFVGAGQAFASAAIWGTVGAAAAIAGRAIAPSQKDQSSGGGYEGSTSTSGASGASDTSEKAGPRVQIVVQGHVFGLSGAEELAEILNDAVENRDVRLVATTTRRGGRSTQ